MTALVIFFSKSLLRHPLARSDIEEFSGDSSFRWIIPEIEHGKSVAEPKDIKRVILCTGQVWAALHKHRADQGITDTAITRVEQLNPFPWEQLKENLDMYPNAETIVWAQEEPLNAGAWAFMQPRIETLLNNTENHTRKHVMYAGRNPSASVATGMKANHVKEEKELLEDAFSVRQDKLKGE
jgi:2-oxoglutarate dehydrogenase E1 component